jgi:hypothetical protein
MASELMSAERGLIALAGVLMVRCLPVLSDW